MYRSLICFTPRYDVRNDLPRRRPPDWVEDAVVGPDPIAAEMERPIHGEENVLVHQVWLVVHPRLRDRILAQMPFQRLQERTSSESRVTTSTISLMPKPPPRLGQITLYSKNRGFCTTRALKQYWRIIHVPKATAGIFAPGGTEVSAGAGREGHIQVGRGRNLAVVAPKSVQS